MKNQTKVSRRAKVRLASFSLAAFLVLGGFWLDAHLSLGASQTQLEYGYRRALGDLTDYVAGMQSTLQKARYASAASTQSAVSAELLEQSGGAKAALAALPFSHEKTERISRFLSQSGDYAMALTRKAFTGAPLDHTDLEGLSTLERYAGILSEALADLQARLTAEGADIVQSVSLLNNVEVIEQIPLLDDDFDAVAEEFSAFPALLYDGPFSDHISRREPLFLQGRESATQEEAAAQAAKLLGCPAGDLNFSGEGGGRLPVYTFTWDNSMVNITKQGGLPSYYKKAGSVSAAKLPYSQALDAAQDYLAQQGLPAMAESYYTINDGLCAINFHSLAETQDGQQVLCYPDLVKVVIELQEGGTVECDAAGYLMNHHDRQLPAPKYSREQAEQSLSPLLRAESARLAVIPTPGLSEVLCWELHCTGPQGQEVLSYINAETGLEEQFYLLQRDEHGVLAN